MLLPECVFISNKLFGELLLHTRPPYHLGRVQKFEDEHSFENFIKKYNLLNACCVCTGYRIIIYAVGTIENVTENPILGHSIKAETLSALNKLTTFYETERIKGNESRLKKFAR